MNRQYKKQGSLMKSLNFLFRKWHQSLILFFIGIVVTSLFWAPENKFLIGTAIATTLYILSAKLLETLKSDNTSASLLQNFYESFDEILDFSRGLYSQSDSLKKVIETEASAVQSSASAVAEISSMLTKTASGAENLVKLSNQANSQIEITTNSVHDLNTLMTQLKDLSRNLNTEAAEKLAELQQITDSMNEIRSCTSSINEIVFQTKLLSFNASVEAARAGDAGRGFSVVSEEMGLLAKKSGEASAAIEKIVLQSIEVSKARIQSVTDSIKELTEKTIHNLEQANVRTTDVVESTDQIKNLFQQVNTMSEEISAATKEQDIGVRDVSNSLHKLESSSHELSKVSKSTFQTSLTLSGKTEEMSKSIFTLSKELGLNLQPIMKKFDFAAAISAHIDWKMKLTKYMQKPDGSLKPDTVCLDNACVLGKWIYGDGQVHKHQHQKSFENLRLSHAEFHKTAAKIITQIDNGQIKDAEKLLSPSGNYSVISEKTIELIKNLRDSVEPNSNTQHKTAS